MKNKLIVGGVFIALVLGGAIAADATKGTSSQDDFKVNRGVASTETLRTPTVTNGQKIELESEHGQTFYKVEAEDDSTHAVDSTVITLEEASQIASNTVGGTIIEVEKEIEHGRLEYKFEMKSSHGEVVVRIDAQSGTVTRIDNEDD